MTKGKRDPKAFTHVQFVVSVEEKERLRIFCRKHSTDYNKLFRSIVSTMLDSDGDNLGEKKELRQLIGWGQK